MPPIDHNDYAQAVRLVDEARDRLWEAAAEVGHAVASLDAARDVMAAAHLNEATVTALGDQLEEIERGIRDLFNALGALPTTRASGGAA